MNANNTTLLPSTKQNWLTEIAVAYYDAYEAIPFGTMTEKKIEEKELFHMAPYICLKFRGLKRTKKNVNIATEAALSSYVATEKTEDVFTNAHLVFAFSYLASHFGLEMLNATEVTDIMEYLEEHQQELETAITNAINKKRV